MPEGPGVYSILVWPARPIPPLLITILSFICEGKGLATLANELL